MARSKAVSDEEIIAAILQHGTIREAAQAAGLTPRAIYTRMDNRDFRSMYMAAKDDIVRKAVFSMQEKLSQAIDAVADIMNDQSVNPAVRLQAAQTILNNAGKFSARLAVDEYNARSEKKDIFSFEL